MRFAALSPDSGRAGKTGKMAAATLRPWIRLRRLYDASRPQVESSRIAAAKGGQHCLNSFHGC